MSDPRLKSILQIQAAVLASSKKGIPTTVGKRGTPTQVLYLLKYLAAPSDASYLTTHMTLRKIAFIGRSLRVISRSKRQKPTNLLKNK